MPVVSVDLSQSIVDRLEAIASETSRPVETLAQLLLAHAIEMYDVAKTPEEVEQHVASFSPKLPRPVIDRDRLRATVDKYRVDAKSDQK